MSDSFVTLWTAALRGSSVHEISQTRILECIATFFSKGSQPRDWTHVFCIGRWTTSAPPGKPNNINTSYLFLFYIMKIQFHEKMMNVHLFVKLGNHIKQAVMCLICIIVQDTKFIRYKFFFESRSTWSSKDNRYGNIQNINMWNNTSLH